MSTFDPNKERELIAVLDCDAIEISQEVQSLWSGYGKILRARVINGKTPSIIIKFCSAPKTFTHPRGWNTNVSQARKMRSYQIEKHWYTHWLHHCPPECRVAEVYWASSSNNTTIIAMEDLDLLGFSRRVEEPTSAEIGWCLRWLARFHAQFLNVNPHKENAELWSVGNYWNLQTRQEEWNAMADSSLKNQAQKIDDALRSNAYPTIIHGDAKIANFCFNPRSESASAVDFQYVGGGCGIQDVVMFFSSCLSGEECKNYAEAYLEDYFSELKCALISRKSDIDFSDLEKEWRKLYPVAWADFARFLQGWKPGHWKLHDYCMAQIEIALDSINH